ncbi:hypothetical protein [Sulfuriroseicoccus oceanibius]|uniref:Uncharacterized protein n=1 Tax=Sulfuriroseicoccus oceanibius TaxID=2707525 RepID=A0A6B3L2Q9_9BACT|nr:hypothetical protein [Sulfuriroseicoccus oceanibius]QQL46133.1 hypothetical protein G3M56_006005 [Sulfuriroseicoccus oceanibius]
MKTNPLIPSSLVLVALSTLAASANTDSKHKNQIIQIQTNEFGEEVRAALNDLGEAGSTNAPLPILYGDATFELWSINTETAEQKLLDTTVVNGFYSPEVVVITPDPNDTPTNPRTRVDKGYSVQIDGISPAYHSAAATQLTLLYNKEPYPADTFAHPSAYTTDYADATDVSSALSTMMASPASFSSGFVSDDWEQVAGTETFSIWNPATDSASATMADSHSVQVWPVANAYFESSAGIEGGETYRQFDPIKINIDNLYAKDNWSVEIIDPNNNATQILGGTVIGDAPQSRQVRISNLGKYLGESGQYTLRVTQQAEGLDPEPVEHIGVTFTYDRRIVVNAQIGTSE